MDATQLYDTLYIGSIPEKGLALYNHGFRRLVLCAQELEPYQLDRDYIGIHVLRCPIDDASLSKREIRQVRECSIELLKLYKFRQKTLVTCAQGRNRSGLVCALILRSLLSMSGQHAKMLVQSRRKNALTNPSFAQFLDVLNPPIQT